MNRLKSYLKYRLRRFLELDRSFGEVDERLDVLEQTVYQAAGILRPPHKMNYVGSGDFTQVGEVLLRDFIELGQLQPHESVLDVGCGIGRTAIPLTRYLSDDGSYQGFDIVQQGIDWCRTNIEASHPNFHFTWVNLYNLMYNPQATQRASQFAFPYADHSFDFVFATSVFTHMLVDDMRNYLQGIARVMRSGARSLITYHLLNPASRAAMNHSAASSRFSYRLNDVSWTNDQATPENGVAFDEEFIRGKYLENGLKITSVYYGAWSGRSDGVRFQDIVVAVKE